MGRARNMRSKQEGSFLENVRDLLVVLHKDISEIKSRLNSSDVCPGWSWKNENSESLLPPPAPPCLDVFRRDHLLAMRRLGSASQIALGLPKAVAIQSAKPDLEQALDVDTFASPENMNTTVAQMDHDDSTGFLWNEEHFEVDENPEATTHGEESLIRSRIVDAQCEAYARMQKEHTAIRSKQGPKAAQRQAYHLREIEAGSIRRIQSFWRSCKEKLTRKCTSLNKAYDEPARWEMPCYRFIPTENESRNKEMLKQRSKTMHAYIMDPDLAQLFGTDTSRTWAENTATDRNDPKRKERIEMLDDWHMDWFSDIVERTVASGLPREKHAAMIYKEVFLYYNHYKEEMQDEQVRIIVQYIEYAYGVLKSEVLPFSCQECTIPQEEHADICNNCKTRDKICTIYETT
jgi:hypothetical protein